MGNIYDIAHSNDFVIKNLHDFKSGLEGFKGEYGTVQYRYHDFKRRSKNAEINVSSDRFERWLENEQGVELDILEYLRGHIKDGEVCTIHLVSYEHPQDMTITKYVITSTNVSEVDVLD